MSGGDFEGGDFKVAADARKISNDRLEISVWSKFDDKKMKGKYTCPLNYKSNLVFDYQGKYGAMVEDIPWGIM